LQTGTKSALETSDDLRTGCPVPENGVYRVIHRQHRLPKEVTLLLGESFPRCSKCSEPVYFQFIRSARLLGMNSSAFRVALYELSEIAGVDQTNESLAS
jgi:hypothetical protein